MKMVSTAKFLLSQITLMTFFIMFSLFLPVSSSAIVSGQCSNCHTMHNSQNGAPVAKSGGWGNGGLGGSSQNTPNNTLLVTSCVGCHSSTTSETIHDPAGLKIPIVFNINGYPSQPLAGGNFYWVSQRTSNTKYSTYGHNVYGIAAGDDFLTQAPGKMTGCGSTACHNTLAVAPDVNNYGRGGCQGCHVLTSHHKNRNWYRFLKGHEGTNPFDPGFETAEDYVVGKGDADWEQTKNSSKHNWYSGIGVGDLGQGYYSDGSGLVTYRTITSFCSGCHSRFHNQNQIDGSDFKSPWKRHPTDIFLPNTGEYSGYNPAASGGYSVEAPVAWDVGSPTSWPTSFTPTRDKAVVMCLSCHRPHGSDQPDLLRWDYATMIASGGGSGGCFTCHTTKDNAP